MKIDLLGALLKSNASWNDVKKATIRNCFRHCGLSVSGEAGANSPSDKCIEYLEELDHLWSQLSNFPGAVCDGTASTGFVSISDDVETTRELADADIVASVAKDLAGDSNCLDSACSDSPTCFEAPHGHTVSPLLRPKKAVDSAFQSHLTTLESDNQLKVESVSLPCHERSVRNCPWSASLWASYLKALERSHAEHNKVKETMEQALQAGFSQGQDYQRLWLAFLDYLRRRVDAHSAQGDELLTPYVEDLRASFQKAVEHLLQYSSTEDDICGPVLKYWAKVEAKVCRNLPRARTLETLDVATEKYEAHMRRVLDKREKAAAREAAREAEQEAQKKIHRAEKKAEKKAEKAAEKAEKKAERKAERHAEKRREAEAKVFQRVPPGYAKRKAQPPREPPDNQEQATDKDGFKVPLLPAAKAAATAAEEPPSKKQKTEGEEESVGKEESPKHGEVVKPDPLKDIRTVFLSNLAFDVEEEQITEAFKEVGEIEELRLVRDYKGRSKGFGYLVFTHMHRTGPLSSDQGFAGNHGAKPWGVEDQARLLQGHWCPPPAQLFNLDVIGSLPSSPSLPVDFFLPF
ncbi:hypothetical protein HPB49_010804 [Dermacentor silvarum]|uniref:Uncharacterized protein n=1 Tax=Dermacentor silvarum TaxID=543639 RepID=A0ACB8D4S0_DERSI|nr:hypothetical protein HPB49_010804 [Dermacentor silvarum]